MHLIEIKYDAEHNLISREEINANATSSDLLAAADAYRAKGWITAATGSGRIRLHDMGRTERRITLILKSK